MSAGESFSKTTLDILRHGNAEGGKIFRGTTDSLLSPQGFEQMCHTLGETPPKWDLIVSSPLRRCSDFAEMLAEQYQVPIKIDINFQEINFGDWEGQLVDDVYSAEPKIVENFWQNPIDFPAPNAETMHDFKTRIEQALQQLMANYKGKHLLLVTHGGVTRLILAYYLQMPLRPLSRLAVPEAALSRIEIYHQYNKSDWPQLVFMNGVYP